MSRTMWLALFCMIGLGAVIATKLATPASLVVEPAQDHSKIESAVAVNESGKVDRLKLPDTPAKAEIVAPAKEAMPMESPPTSPETIEKTENGHLQDANATAMSVASPPRHAKKESKESAVQDPPKPRAVAWRCRQDAMGGLLRSLDLSPRCNM
jgi:hypothetical protein